MGFQGRLETQVRVRASPMAVKAFPHPESRESEIHLSDTNLQVSELQGKYGDPERQWKSNQLFCEGSSLNTAGEPS